MAYYSEDQDDQQQEPGAQPAPNSAPSAVVGAQGGSSAAPAATPAPAAQSKGGGGSRSSNFVGISDYIKANKPQTQKLANTVGGYVGAEAGKARSQLADAETGFNQQVTQNTRNLDENLVNQIKANPNEVAGNQELFQKARNMGTAYAGPTDLATSDAYKTTEATAKKAQAMGEKLNNENSQLGLLQDYQKDTRGKIHKGASILDQGLLANSPEAKQTLAAVKQDIATVPKNLQDALARGLQQSSQAKAKSDQTNKAYADLFTGEQGLITGKNAELQKKVADAQAAQQRASATNNSIREQFLSGQGLSGEAQKLLGISGLDQTELYTLASEYGEPGQGLTGNKFDVLGKYLKQNQPGAQADISNVASADDMARLDALYSLSGGSNPLDRSRAGSFKVNDDLLDFDLGGALGELRGKKGKADQIKQALALQQQQQADAEAERIRQIEAANKNRAGIHDGGRGR